MSTTSKFCQNRRRSFRLRIELDNHPASVYGGLMVNTSYLQRFAAWLLRAAERFYLRAHGWQDTYEAPDHFLPPGEYPFRQKVAEYHRRHAVNAQHAVYGARTQGTV